MVVPTSSRNGKPGSNSAPFRESPSCHRSQSSGAFLYPWAQRGASSPSWSATAPRPSRSRPKISVAQPVEAEIRAEHIARNTGESEPGRYDGHRNYIRLKISALLASLAGRLSEVGEEDWELAGVFMDASDSVRDWCLEQIAAEARERESAQNAAAGRRVAVEETRRIESTHAVKRVAKLLAHACESEPKQRGELTRAVASRDRGKLPAALEFACGRGWIVPRDGKWHAGEAVDK